MCFFTEAQQRAFDAIQQRRAQAAAQAVQVSGFNPYAPPACAPPTAVQAPAPTAVAATAAQSSSVDESTAAKVAQAFANTSPQFVTRFIQEVVQQQLQQQASQTAPFSMAHHTLAGGATSAGPVVQDSLKRTMDDALAGEPMLKRQKYDDGSSSDSEKRSKKQKRRFVWTADLRELFDRAVASMEPELVGPKNIYKYMTRIAPAMVRDSEINTQHIKSHLQKWRIARRRGLPMPLDGSGSGNDDSAICAPPSQLPPHMPAHPQAPSSSDHQLFNNPTEASSNACTTVFAYQTPAPSVSISPESAVQAHPPNVAFQSPPAPIPKSLELEPPLLLDDFDTSCDPLLSSWDSLFSDSPAEESLVPAPEGDMIPPVPSDVLAELSKAVGGSNAGLSTSEILKYMMLGYQLGYQNCFTELAPADGAEQTSVSNTTASSGTTLSLF